MDDSLVLVKTVASEVEADMLCALLKDAGIPVVVKQPGLSGLASVYMGYSNLGAQLYVSPEDETHANELLSAFASGGEAEFEWPEGMEPEEESEE